MWETFQSEAALPEGSSPSFAYSSSFPLPDSKLENMTLKKNLYHNYEHSTCLLPYGRREMDGKVLALFTSELLNDINGMTKFSYDNILFIPLTSKQNRSAVGSHGRHSWRHSWNPLPCLTISLSPSKRVVNGFLKHLSWAHCMISFNF